MRWSSPRSLALLCGPGTLSTADGKKMRLGSLLQELR